MNKLLVVLFITIGNFHLLAQDNRYVIFFTDKENSKYSIDNPEAFLSARAIERRQDQNVDITIDDLPVNKQYVENLEALGVKVFFTSRWFNAALVEADSATIASAEQQSFVLKAEFVAPGVRLTGSGSKSGLSYQGKPYAQRNSITSEDQNKMLGVPDMHEQGYTGEGILIAVLDGGFDNVDNLPFFDHLYTDNSVVATYDFVENTKDVYRYADHGTKVLSTIASMAPGSLVGTAYDADFILCVTEDVMGEYRIEEYNWLFAAEFADSAGADIINTSLGYTTFNDASMNYIHEDLDGKKAVISRASAMAASKGILLVTSAGNEGNGSWGTISAPADADSILSVGAVDLDFQKASFSSPGPTADGRLKPEIAALGVGTTVGSSSGKFVQSNGTSFAAPLITGLAAGIWQAYPDLTNIELIEKIKNSGNHAKFPDNLTGYGVPNFTRVQLEIVLTVDKITDHIFRIYPNPASDGAVCIETESTTPGKIIEIRIYNSTGKLLDKKDLITKLKNNKFKVAIENFHPGVYIVNITSSNTSESLKLIKF